MKRALRKVICVASACAVSALAGCATLSGDPLSPPHVRYVACATQNVGRALEEKLSPEYQQWLADVRHFCRDTYAEFEDEYHRTDMWPEPYTTLSVHSVRTPLAIQAENARLQMLSLWDYHFESGTGKLTVMGRTRLEDIVDQASALGNVVYVHRSSNAMETAARVADVRREIGQQAADADSFEIVEARTTPSTVSGGEAKRAVDRLVNPPQSSSSNSSGSSSGSSGSSSGGGSSGSR